MNIKCSRSHFRPREGQQQYVNTEEKRQEEEVLCRRSSISSLPPELAEANKDVQIIPRPSDDHRVFTETQRGRVVPRLSASVSLCQKH